MAGKHYLIRSLLWFICAYHVAVGLLLNLSQTGVVWAARNLGGLTVNVSPELAYLVKPFGMYLIAFGIAMGVAAWNPVKNRAIITIGVVLIALRVIQRIVCAGEVQELFNVSAGRNMVSIVIVALFGVALAVLRIRLYLEMTRGGVAEAEAPG